MVRGFRFSTPAERRRGGYQPPESRRTPAEPRRAACSHAAMAGPRCPGAWCFRRCGSGAYTMRPYNEKGGRCVCRGGFHIRPYRPSIPATPRQTDQVIARRRGGLYGRPCRPPISNPPPPNAVGAAISRPCRLGLPAEPRRAACPHAAMAGPRCPGAWCFRRCGSGAYTMRPYNEKGGRCVCRGGFHIRPYRPSIPATPRQTDQVIGAIGAAVVIG